MKKIILIIFLALIGCSVAQDSVAVFELPQASSIADTDEFLLEQSDSTRAAEWVLLKTTMRSYLLGQNNTWTGTNTFNGSINSSASNSWTGSNTYNSLLQFAGNGTFVLPDEDNAVFNFGGLTQQINVGTGAGFVIFHRGSGEVEVRDTLVDRSYVRDLTLADLSDVTITSPDVPTFIAYNGAGWIDYNIYSQNNTWTGTNGFQSAVTLENANLSFSGTGSFQIPDTSSAVDPRYLTAENNPVTGQGYMFFWTGTGEINSHDTVAMREWVTANFSSSGVATSDDNTWTGEQYFAETGYTITSLSDISDDADPREYAINDITVIQWTGSLDTLDNFSGGETGQIVHLYINESSTTAQLLLRSDAGSGLFSFDGDKDIYLSAGESITLIKTSSNWTVLNYSNMPNIYTQTSGTTINAEGREIIKFQFASTPTMTAVTGGYAGQRLTLYNGTNFDVTLQDGTNLQMPGGSNLVLGGYDTAELLCVDGTVWICLYTSDNS